jgi:5-formyltetrahydrofolate cyclo-ligase
VKKAVRKKARVILESLTVDEVNNLSRKVSENIFSLISDLKSSHHFITDHLKHSQRLSIGVYVPIQAEVRWYANTQLSQSREKELDKQFEFSVPHLVDETQMVYYQVDLDSIKKGNLGLSLDECWQVTKVKPDVILVPGLAFTHLGARLGRGKGYFDRYLASFRGVKIGVAFEAQILKDLPVDEYDINMDYIVTENQIYKGINK